MSDLSIELHWQRTTPVFASGQLLQFSHRANEPIA
jgi:hypothetical protein